MFGLSIAKLLAYVSGFSLSGFIKGAVEFFKSPLGVTVALILTWIVSGWYYTKVANDKCEARIEKSVSDAQAIDKTAQDDANRQMAEQLQDTTRRLKVAEDKSNAYLELNKDNPSCLSGDSDLLRFNLPERLREKPLYLPNPGPTAPRR